MKERPILFSAPMVRAILEGRKTQTRRAVKPHIVSSMDPPRGKVDADAGYPFVELGDGSFVSVTMLCPYGRPGDRLWVRETWKTDLAYDDMSPRQVIPASHVEYQADGAVIAGAFAPEVFNPGKSRPSIFMPRWASRITLEVTDIRVQQLNSIPLADIMAEGVEFGDADKGEKPWHNYQALWESINGSGSWDANHWVWVVEFKRVTNA